MFKILYKRLGARKRHTHTHTQDEYYNSCAYALSVNIRIVHYVPIQMSHRERSD